ncbi:MAG: transposase [Opitutaceae bacterium]|nr:transposase [Opitutaceae bacterium]
MRRPRLKIDPREGAHYYHCMSRTVNSEWLFAEGDREALRKLIWAVSEFCGLRVVTYAILSNHFHLLVKVPKATFVEDEEVLRRYAVLYPNSATPITGSGDNMPAASTINPLPSWMDKQRRQMGDLSAFMKILKQRFTNLFNTRHERHGTLWSERFKSVLVEGSRALKMIAAYIDLNAVRAGLVQDPKDYRFCGYSEAVAGNGRARKGLCEVIEEMSWKNAAPHYRRLLFGIGSKPSDTKGSISHQALEGMLRSKGVLPLHVVLRCRVRYLSEGGIVGSRNFVAGELQKLRRKYGRVRGLEPRTLPPIADWGPITLLRRCQAGICEPGSEPRRAKP